QYYVEHFDFKERKAYVKRVDVNYYTDAVRYTQVRVLEVAASESASSSSSLTSSTSHSHGDVLVRSQVVGFKKIKFFTNETIGENPPSLRESVALSEAKGLNPASLNLPRETEFFEPNLYLFDAYPGGIGFSEPLFRAHDVLMQKTRELISSCECEQGCPSCVGPAEGLLPRAKEAALAILHGLCA